MHKWWVGGGGGGGREDACTRANLCSNPPPVAPTLLQMPTACHHSCDGEVRRAMAEMIFGARSCGPPAETGISKAFAMQELAQRGRCGSCVRTPTQPSPNPHPPRTHPSPNPHPTLTQPSGNPQATLSTPSPHPHPTLTQPSPSPQLPLTQPSPTPTTPSPHPHHTLITPSPNPHYTLISPHHRVARHATGVLRGDGGLGGNQPLPACLALPAAPSAWHQQASLDPSDLGDGSGTSGVSRVHTATAIWFDRLWGRCCTAQAQRPTVS